MTTTKLGRQTFGHRCTYSCDCDCEVSTVSAPPEAIAAGAEYIDSLPPEPLDSAHCPPRDEMSGPARFSGVMCCVAVVAMFWIVVLAAVWEWVTR